MQSKMIRLVVEVFAESNFRGKSSFIVEPIRHTKEIGLHDRIASLRVYRGPHYSNPNYKVILYQHVDFQGKKIGLGPGYYPYLNDTAYNFSDMISSINFGSMTTPTGPEWGTIPVVVECYEHVNFEGRKITILRDVANLRDAQGGTWFEDMVSSIRVFKGPNFPPTPVDIIFYEHPEFEGAQLPIHMYPTDRVKEISNLHLLPQDFGDSVSAIKIQSWASSGEFTGLVFEDEFFGNDMRREWRWEDPNGGGSWSERQGYLEMRAEPGQDLWHGNNGRGGNMDAPRLLTEVSGDFAIECRIPVSAQLKEHGGLIVWKHPHRFIRLEKTSGPHGFRGDVRFERHVNGVFNLIGRGQDMQKVRELFLRLERRGNTISGFASEDAIHWKSCGQTNVGMGDPVRVGLHALCPGNIPPTLTRFDYFRIFKRQSEAAQYLARFPALVGRIGDEHARRREAEQRRRAMRDLV